MATDLHVAISAQMALQRRMETVAQNIANLNTTGYRAEGVKFEAVMDRTTGQPVAFASTGASFVSTKSGPIEHTGNSLDIAVDGKGWFGLSAPDGTTVYTRDGRLHLTDLGEVQSVGGLPIVDPGGAPISVDPAAGPIQVTENGAVLQGGAQIGAIGVFLLPEDAKLTRYGNSSVTSDMPGTPVEDSTNNSVRQGFLEGSNVNPILEMTRMIELARSFDKAAAAIQNSDDAQQQAVRALSQP